MKDKLKNIIMFAVIFVVLVGAYFYFTGGEDSGLVTTDYLGGETVMPSSSGDSQLASDFLPVLLSIRGIKLDTSIFNDPAFLSLRDSSIELIPDGNEGRPNPFAPIGSDAGAPVVAEPIPSDQQQY